MASCTTCRQRSQARLYSRRHIQTECNNRPWTTLRSGEASSWQVFCYLGAGQQSQRTHLAHTFTLALVWPCWRDDRVSRYTVG